MAKTRTLVGLDIGTSEIKTLIVQKTPDEESLQILSQSREIASGIRKGVVVNVEEVARIIASCIKKAEEPIHKKINGVYVNIGGSHIFFTSSRGLISVSRADQKISQEDVDRVIQAAQTFSLPSNKEILEVFPKEFIIDGERGIKEPLGMQGVRLEAEVLALGCFSPYLKNLTQAVLNSGLQINDLILTPLAASRAVLTPREKELGVALLDIGAATTGLAVFEEENLIHTAIFPLGSVDITKDIAILLRIDIDTAERIKLEFGSCVYRGTNKKEKIKGEFLPELLVFSQKNLVEIIEARTSEIFDQVNKELKKIFRQGLLPAGIVLTGGGAKLPKIVELAKKELKLPCRIGLPQGFFPDQEDSSLSTACGLILCGLDSEEEGVSRVRFGQGIGAKIKRMFKIFIP